jgi:hypothetical protein
VRLDGFATADQMLAELPALHASNASTEDRHAHADR